MDNETVVVYAIAVFVECKPDFRSLFLPFFIHIFCCFSLNTDILCRARPQTENNLSEQVSEYIKLDSEFDHRLQIVRSYLCSSPGLFCTVL